MLLNPADSAWRSSAAEKGGIAKAAFMDALQLFAVVSAALMLAFYAFEDYSLWTVLGFATSAALGAVAAALLGAYWIAALAAIWAVIAGKRWQKRRLAGKPAA
jgi:hypothetical protein